MPGSRLNESEWTPQRLNSVSSRTSPPRSDSRGQVSGPDWGRRMSDAEYFAERAHQELLAAMCAPDRRVRERHLELADAYAFRLSEEKRSARVQLFFPAGPAA